MSERNLCAASQTHDFDVQDPEDADIQDDNDNSPASPHSTELL